ncbi:(d)CMP kinase [Listeria fleischmannii]|uniref:Cytidylate kinase n=1 Tax=Listeria fleischmannii TaxID=1069827 RepID=A0A841YD11_9LIST|nr:(d)CMP kinase [Listeria fleischmannii]EIA21014.1 cytidylate kinase [Listeria fleischmannii subsp. coloradonensis]MBC1398222.1 (d)CMP kinase [Listeria fleischmannii]MBC1418551.1 (d)CMP kinase [Listeria fleischmannii]MBC1426283.1 (d)CMP kinase [Listeria fleischmannii]STY35551.1 Cytidylate kinase [Listeria fleischmannii subsp. coloradonensis]
MTKKICIAIDGPAAAGKSTVAKIVAKKLGFIYIDTGAMYRAVTYLAFKNNIDYTNEVEISKLLKNTVIRFEPGEVQQVFIDDLNVTEIIRSSDVTNHVSIVAALPSIRVELQKRQQLLAEEGGVVMDGRDIGTAVLPNAELKIFLLASVEERAERRFKENKAKGFDVNMEQLRREIEERDHLDYTREHSPLKKADDAITVDTTSMDINEVATKILMLEKQVTDK